MKFYPTQIEAFLNCPRKYRFGRDPELKAKYFKASPHLVLGNAVHDALEVFFDIGKTKIGERTHERLCDLMRHAWGGTGVFKRNNWKQTRARKEAFEGDRATEKAWGEKGLHMLYRFFQTQDTTVVPLTAEQFHEFPLTEDIVLGGKIDRIDRQPDGRLDIIDYKTGKPPWKKDPESLRANDLQLAYYAILVTEKFRGQVASCSYLYLNDDLRLSYEPDAELLAEKKAQILSHCGRILGAWKEDAFPPTPNNLCGWCDFLEICDEGKEHQKAKEAAAPIPDELPF